MGERHPRNVTRVCSVDKVKGSGGRYSRRRCAFPHHINFLLFLSLSPNNSKNSKFSTGWSLGGLLALEISRILADDPNLHVAGVVLVDTYHPRSFPDFGSPSSRKELDIHGLTKPEILEKTRKAFEQAKVQIRTWRMEGWVESSAENAQHDGRGGNTSIPFKPPRAVLIRATEPTPNEIGGSKQLDPSGKMAVDGVHGWSQLDPQFIEKTYYVQGHHFSIFNNSNVRQRLCDVDSTRHGLMFLTGQ